MGSFETLILILVLVVFAVFAIIYVLSTQMKRLKDDLGKQDDTVLMEWLKEMKSSVDKNSDTLERQLKDQRGTLEDQLKNQRLAMNEQTKLIWERLDNASEVIKGVQHQLGGIQEFGKDIKDLSNILKSPKLRGGMGEQFLYDILGNSLPKDLFKTQYRFKNGEICDAVIFTEKGIIPIDSKFPMENFKAMVVSETPTDRDKARKTFISDVKKRIDEISSKYILPEEKTTEQAVMYIPSESVYYELIVNTPEVEEYAKNKNIVMSSPNTFSYFVKVILVAYQQHELEKHAGEILKALAGIKIEADKFEGELGVLDRHISNAYKAMENVQNKFGKLSGKIDRVHALDTNDEQQLLIED